MAYICRLTPKKGALNLEKCVEKGVPPGPLLGKLKNDENIYLSDGTEVKADDVKYPDSPGVVFISNTFLLYVLCFIIIYLK